MNPFVILFFGVVFLFICAFVAKKKGRDPFLWGIAGLFFAALALITLLILPSLNQSKSNTDEAIIEDLKEMQELENTDDSLSDDQTSSSNKLWYYLNNDNQQFGPMTLDALFKDLKEGKINNNTYVWNDEMNDWKPLSETSDFQNKNI